MKNFFLPFVFFVVSATSSVSVIAEELTIEVFKTPWCGCCKAWTKHLENNGFVVVERDLQDLSSIKSRFGITRELASCHTGVIDGYFVEGHVPASDIKRMLSDKSNVNGLSVPGMPAGQNVPGMETRPGNASYDVYAISDTGVTVFNSYK